MSQSRRASGAWCVLSTLALLALLACGQDEKGTATVDPAASKGSAPSSAPSVSAPSPSASGRADPSPRPFFCVNGALRGGPGPEPDPDAAHGHWGASAASASASGSSARAAGGAWGGWGNGIGLGTVGGYGHGAGTGTGQGYTGGPGRSIIQGLTATLDSPRGETARGAALELCAQSPALRACFDADYEKTHHKTTRLRFSLTRGAGGESVPGAELTKSVIEPELTTCVTAALAKAAIPGGLGALEIDLSFTRTPTVRLIDAKFAVVGKLPTDVAKRIVRAHYPRLRACYESTLERAPATRGTVDAALTVGADGAVESAKADAGTLTDPVTRSCVAGVLRTLSFPESGGGKVEITYSIDFSRD